MRLLRWIWRSIRSWFLRKRRPLKAVRVDEVPDILDPKCVYVVGERSHLWFVVMICPCGCGETLHMTLLEGHRPRWHLLQHPDGTITLQPSVCRQVGCGSHFYLRRSLVAWCVER